MESPEKLNEYIKRNIDRFIEDLKESMPAAKRLSAEYGHR